MLKLAADMAVIAALQYPGSRTFSLSDSDRPPPGALLHVATAHKHEKTSQEASENPQQEPISYTEYPEPDIYIHTHTYTHVYKQNC